MRWRPEGHAGHLRIARVRWFSLAAPEPDNTARREIARQEHPIRSMGNTPVEKRGDLHGFKRIIQLEDLPRSAPLISGDGVSQLPTGLRSAASA